MSIVSSYSKNDLLLIFYTDSINPNLHSADGKLDIQNNLYKNYVTLVNFWETITYNIYKIISLKLYIRNFIIKNKETHINDNLSDISLVAKYMLPKELKF